MGLLTLGELSGLGLRLTPCDQADRVARQHCELNSAVAQACWARGEGSEECRAAKADLQNFKPSRYPTPTTPPDDWATSPCTRHLPPSCVGRMKVQNKVLRDCYDYVCPTTQATLDAQVAAIRAARAAQAELAALRRRRELLLAAQAAGATGLPPALMLSPLYDGVRRTALPPTPEPTPPSLVTPALPRRPRRAAFDTSNLIWLMAGAVAAMALRR